jgi:hypothetical protein
MLKSCDIAYSNYIIKKVKVHTTDRFLRKIFKNSLRVKERIRKKTKGFKRLYNVKLIFLQKSVDTCFQTYYNKQDSRKQGGISYVNIYGKEKRN